MDQNQIEEFKKILLDKKATLEKQLDEVADKNPKIPGDYKTKFEEVGDDIEDEGVEVESYINARPAVDALELNLKQVNEALARIESGTYGICVEMGIEIPIERLRAIPETPICIEAENKQ